MNEVGVTSLLTSGRTLKQGRGMELGKLSKDYFDEVAVCELDSVTMEVLGLTDGDPILVQSEFGSVVVHCRQNRRAEPGVVFIPCGPYANVVTGSDTVETGMPNFKNIPVTLYAAKGRKVLNIEDLLKDTLGVD